MKNKKKLTKCWQTLAIPANGKLMQEDCCELQASLENRESMSYVMSSCQKKKNTKETQFGMEAHTCNPTQETKAGGLPGVQNQPGLQSETLDQTK